MLRVMTGRRIGGARALDAAAAMMDAMFDDVDAFVGGGRGTKRANDVEWRMERPRVEETTRGFLITAKAPGVGAADVAVRATTDARGRATLRIEAGGRAVTELGLPTKYIDMSVTPRASCIDGVLRIAVLKKSPEILRVPIRSAADETPREEGDERMETDEDESSITLSVPGFSARDISVALHKPDDCLVVEGASKMFGNFKKTFRNLPPELQLKHITATVAHGLLSIKMEDPTAIEPMDIIVSNVAPRDEDVASNEKLVTLLRRSVPGVSADKVTCALKADRTLRVDVRTDHTRASVSINVPKNLDFSTLEARCVDGILTVTCERDASAAGAHTVDIEVSGERPASFIDAVPVEHDAPSGELPTTEALEVIDYDGKVEDVAER